MKVYSLLVLIAIIYGIESKLTGFTDKKCSKYYGQTKRENQAYSYDFCRTLEIDDGYSKCCYMKVKCNDTRTYYSCAPITLDDYYDIKNTIKRIESQKQLDIRTFYCNSSYLYGSLFLILIFLL